MSFSTQALDNKLLKLKLKSTDPLIDRIAKTLFPSEVAPPHKMDAGTLTIDLKQLELKMAPTDMSITKTTLTIGTTGTPILEIWSLIKINLGLPKSGTFSWFY